VGTPGPLDQPGNPMRNTNCRWDGFHLKSAITSALGRDIVLESDGNLAAFAERELGAGKRYRVDNMRILTLGTGIGNGLILNGDISEASDAIAMEAGRIIGDGKDSSTSEFGCLKQSASETAVKRMARERFGGAAPSSARELAKWARSGISRRGAFLTLWDEL
jgi:glucokinase